MTNHDSKLRIAVRWILTFIGFYFLWGALAHWRLLDLLILGAFFYFVIPLLREDIERLRRHFGA